MQEYNSIMLGNLRGVMDGDIGEKTAFFYYF